MPGKRHQSQSSHENDNFGLFSGTLTLLIALVLMVASFILINADESRSWLVRALLIVTIVGLVLWGSIQLFQYWFPTTSKSKLLQVNRHRVQLPREGLVYLVIMAVLFVGSMLGKSNMLMLVFSLMAGPFVLNGWITFVMLKKIQVMRNVPRQAMAGETVRVDLTIASNKKWLSSWLMAVSDQIRNEHEQLHAGVMFTRIPAGESRTAQYQMRLMQRGRYVIGPLQISTRFPLGLVERGLVVDQQDVILIYPRLGNLSPRWRQQKLIAADMVHHHQTVRGVFEDEFHHIREYRQGDNPRAIHWRTSARINNLMVRQYHQSRDQDMAVLLDLWLPSNPQNSDLDRVERAISFAATVCLDQLRESRESLVQLHVAGQEVLFWAGHTGPASVESCLETCALLQPGTQPNLEALFQAWSEYRTHGMRTILITSCQDETQFQQRCRQISALQNQTALDLQILDADNEELFVIDPI